LRMVEMSEGGGMGPSWGRGGCGWNGGGRALVLEALAR
jgi:hypothetical protein